MQVVKHPNITNYITAACAICLVILTVVSSNAVPHKPAIDTLSSTSHVSHSQLMSILNNERSNLNILAVATGMNSTFYRTYTGSLLGAHTSGDTTISFDKFASNARELVGHQFTLDGNTYTFDTDVDADASGVVTSIGVTPALVTSPADNSIITVTRTKTFYWSVKPFTTEPTDTPANQPFKPVMELSKPVTTPFSAGHGYGQGLELASAEITIHGRELAGGLNWGARYIDTVEPYMFSGREVTLYIVGELDQGADGITTLDWSSKVTLMKALAGKNKETGKLQYEVKWSESKLVIPLRSNGEEVTGNWQRRLKGFGPCPLYPDNPTPDATIYVPGSGSAWDPQGGNVSVLLRSYMPIGSTFTGGAPWFYKGTSFQLIQATDEIEFQIILTDLTTVQVRSGTETLDEDSWFDVAVVVNRTDDNVKMYLDGALVDTETIGSSADISSTTGTDIGIGAFGSSSGNFVGQICQVSLWDEALTQSDVRNYQTQEIPNANNSSLYPNMVAYWPGILDNISGTLRLRDIGPNSLSSFPSAWAGTASSTVEIGESMEGNNETAGSIINKGHGVIRNASATPADLDENTFYYADPLAATQAPTALYLAGEEKTLEADRDLESFIEDTPGASNFFTCSQHSLLKCHTLPNEQSLTVDYGGVSLSPGGYRMRSADSHNMRFTTAPSVFSATHTKMFWLSWYDDETDGQVAFDCISGSTGWDFRYVDNGTDGFHRVMYRLYGDGGGLASITPDFEIRKGEAHHVAIVADESGADVDVTLYLDGISAGTASITGENIATPAAGWNWGTSLTVSNYGDILVSEFSTHNAALTAAQIRDIIYRRSMAADITSGPTAPSYAPNLVNHWGHAYRSSQHSTGNILDNFGNDDTSTGSKGQWTAGTGIQSTLAGMLTVIQDGGVSYDNITIPDSVWTPSMAQYPISYQHPHGVVEIEGSSFNPEDDISILNNYTPLSVNQTASNRKPATVAEILNIIKSGAGAQVVYDPNSGKYCILQMSDPATGTSVHTFEQHHCATPLDLSGNTEPPVQLITMRWGQAATVQQIENLNSNATDDHVAFVTLPWRNFTEPDSLVQDLLPDHKVDVIVLGVWAHERHAALAARLMKLYRSSKLPLPRLGKVEVIGSYADNSNVKSGSITTWNHEDLPGGTSRQMTIVRMEDRVSRTKLSVWG